MAKMNYLELLEHSYEETSYGLDSSMSRLEFVGRFIFDFTTYDSSMDELFAKKAIEVCKAINEHKTFEYQETDDGYLWYLIMVNMPFFKDKLEWGASIRGAWWKKGEELDLYSTGLHKNGEQILEPLKFNPGQWVLFINALAEFTR